MGLFLRKNHLLRSWGVFFSFNLDCVSSLISIHNPLHNLLHNLFVKTVSEKIGVLIVVMSFLPLRLFFISVNLPNGLAWNVVDMFGLVLLAATWKC